MEPLAAEDYQKVFQTNDAFMRELINKSYKETGGNLKSLEDIKAISLSNSSYFVSVNVMEISFKERSPTRINIDTLDKDEIMLLASIVAHKSSVRSDDLKNFSYSTNFIDVLLNIDSSLKKLVSHQLIELHEGLVRIKHDQVSREILGSKDYLKYLSVALKTWTSYYEQIFDSSSYELHSRSQVVAFLFHFYYLTEPRKIMRIAPAIKNIALNSIYPPSALEYLNKIKESLSTQENTAEYTNDIYYFFNYIL